MLGISSFINLTSNGLKIEYDEVSVKDKNIIILIKNYQVAASTKDVYFDSVINIY